MREVLSEILKKTDFNIFELLPFYDILNIANAKPRKLLVLEARNFYLQ